MPYWATDRPRLSLPLLVQSHLYGSGPITSGGSIRLPSPRGGSFRFRMPPTIAPIAPGVLRRPDRSSRRKPCPRGPYPRASETGDPTDQRGDRVAQPGGRFTVPTPAAAAVPIAYANATNNYVGVLNDSVVNLYWPTSYASTASGTAAAATMFNVATARGVGAIAHRVLAPTSARALGAQGASPDNRRPPLWRIDGSSHDESHHDPGNPSIHCLDYNQLLPGQARGIIRLC